MAEIRRFGAPLLARMALASQFRRMAACLRVSVVSEIRPMLNHARPPPAVKTSHSEQTLQTPWNR